jgi:hypothetical protein
VNLSAASSQSQIAVYAVRGKSFVAADANTTTNANINTTAGGVTVAIGSYAGTSISAPASPVPSNFTAIDYLFNPTGSYAFRTVSENPSPSAAPRSYAPNGDFSGTGTGTVAAANFA